MKLDRAKKRISKKIKKGFQGYPIVTIAYYGPTKKVATKISVGVIPEEGDEPQLERFISETEIRNDEDIHNKIIDIITRVQPKSVSAVDTIIGCPHEEGIDYPDGAECDKPQCSFWQGRDRFTGELIH